MEEKISTEKINELVESLESVVNQDDSVKALVELLAMPDEEFELLAPGVLQSYQQQLNNPNDRILLAQSLNATGQKSEDLIEVFNELSKAIDLTDFTKVKRDFLKEFFGSLVNTINETEGIAKRYVTVPVQLCHPDAKIPQYAHISDSGMDVYAIEDITIHPGETVLVKTGIKVALPPGYELQVRPKSGLSLKTKMRVANTPGTIDQEYRDEIGVIIDNIDPPIKSIETEEVFKEDGTIDYLKVKSIVYGSDYYIEKGQKICQLVLSEVPKAAVYTVLDVKNFEGDRNGGFGSTGAF